MTVDDDQVTDVLSVTGQQFAMGNGGYKNVVTHKNQHNFGNLGNPDPLTLCIIFET